MASINGVKITGMKSFKGHEGEPLFQGNVCLNGKKLGFWTQDSWGGTATYHFNESCLNDVVAEYKSGCDGKYVEFIDADILLDDVAHLASMEKEFKRRKCVQAVVVTDKFHYATLYTFEEGDVVTKYAADIEKLKSGLFKNEEHIVEVLNKDSFDIVVDKSHKKPKFL